MPDTTQSVSEPSSNPEPRTLHPEATSSTPEPGTLNPAPGTPNPEPSIQRPEPRLTADEVEQRAYSATQRAIREERESESRKAQEAQAKQLEQQRRAAALPNPVVDAMDAIDLRTDMYEEALALHSDLPQEARDQIKRDLRSFKTIDSLRAARESRLHTKLADAAAGEAIRTGKFVPKSVQAPTREPVGDVASATREPVKLPESYKRQIASLGIELTESELASAYEEDQRLGY